MPTSETLSSLSNTDVVETTVGSCLFVIIMKNLTNSVTSYELHFVYDSTVCELHSNLSFFVKSFPVH